MKPVTLVINTRNEEAHLAECLNSVKDWVSQIVLMDMESSDRTVEISKEFGAEIYHHPQVGYVEPARNKALSLAKQPWVLLLDADESVSETLKEYLEGVIETQSADYVRLPRLNLIFGKFQKYGGWWPDYNVRFFRNGMVEWQDQIHSQPITQGQGIDAPASEEFAIKHNHYQSISQFLSRLDRYTSVQLNDLKGKHPFVWTDLVEKPTGEFFRRYFDLEGWRDGLHGLILALLQAVSELVLYLKLWEAESFVEKDVTLVDFDRQIEKEAKKYHSWMAGLFGKQKLVARKLKHAIWKRL